ncbi:MAG: transporter [Firmicutes bacterium]|nr:transporter [Bacillota bacterium]
MQIFLSEVIDLTMNTQAATSLCSKSFSILFLSNFILFFGTKMFSPFLPAYIPPNGGNNVQIGIIMCIFTLSAILIRIFTAKATEHFNKNALLLTVLLFCAVAAGGYYFTSAFTFIFLLRAFNGIGLGVATTLFGTLVSNALSVPQLRDFMEFCGLGANNTLAVRHFAETTLVAITNYQWVFALSIVLIIFAIFLTQSIANRGSTEIARKTSLYIVLADFVETKALFPSVLVLIFGISIAGMFIFMILFGAEARIENIGMFFLINALAEYIIRPIAAKLYDDWGHFPIIVPGAMICATGAVLLSMTVNLPMLIAVATCYGVGIGMLFPVLEAWALKSVPPDRRAAATTTFYNFLGIGVGFGAIILGLVAQATSYSIMYLYSSLVFALFLAVYFYYCLRQA